MERAQGKPLVTVLMSVFNGERWLEEAIVSVLDQSFTSFEFIIVDDGSTDRSPAIVRRFQNEDPRIVLLRKRNTGLTDSLNCGIQHARGNWIARLDADDICDCRRLERQYQRVKADPQLVFLGSGLLQINESGNPIKVYRYPSSHRALRRNLIRGRNFPPHSSAFMDADLVRSVGGYRTRLKRAQDRDLWLRLSEVGRFGCIEEPLVKHRIHFGQVSREESGRRQRIDSFAARASYWLRRSHFPDPIDSSDQEFDLFHKWVYDTLRERDFFTYHEYIARVKDHVSKRRFDLSWVCGFVREVMSQPRFFFTFILGRFVGERVSRRLAGEWRRLRTHELERIRKDRVS